ncbi:hypothetical protein BC567DRAFT_210619 [Phyllosticta citribraziliensis]
MATIDLVRPQAHNMRLKAPFCGRIRQVKNGHTSRSCSLTGHIKSRSGGLGRLDWHWYSTPCGHKAAVDAPMFDRAAGVRRTLKMASSATAHNIPEWRSRHDCAIPTEDAGRTIRGTVKADIPRRIVLGAQATQFKQQQAGSKPLQSSAKYFATKGTPSLGAGSTEGLEAPGIV